jgi:hypothetical protein
MLMSEPAAKTPLKIFVIIAVCSAVVIACAIALVTVMHSLHAKTTRADIARVADPDPGTTHYLDVGVRIVGVDLEKEKLALQLECVPNGGDLYDGFSVPSHLKYPIYLDVGISDTGTQETKVFSGMSDGGLVDVDLDLDGNVEDYPSDRHVAVLWIDAYRVLPGRFTYPLPIRLDAYGAWPGLNVKLKASGMDTSTGRLSENEGITGREVNFAVTRSQVTTTVVYLSVVLTWILIVSVIGMVVSVLFARRTSEIAMLAFFGTLLFAMTAFRNALPGAPPMGTTSDYLSFFWGYVVAIVAIGVVAADFLWRRSRDEQ